MQRAGAQPRLHARAGRRCAGRSASGAAASPTPISPTWRTVSKRRCAAPLPPQAVEPPAAETPKPAASKVERREAGARSWRDDRRRQPADASGSDATDGARSRDQRHAAATSLQRPNDRPPQRPMPRSARQTQSRPRRMRIRSATVGIRQPRAGDGELARPTARKDLMAARPPSPPRFLSRRGLCSVPRSSARARAGHQHQLRPGRRPDRARHPADRAADGAVARAVDPGDDDVVHADRRGAVAAAHRARHRDRAAQRGDRRRSRCSSPPS